MRYLKLFESYQSNMLTKTMKFVNKEIKDEFKDYLKDICDILDIPESNLSDDLFKYLPYKKALEYTGDLKKDANECETCKKEKDLECKLCNGQIFYYDDNQSDITLIKFWFNSEGKNLITTCVDGVYRPANAIDKEESKFSKNIDDYVEVREIKITEIDELKTGDIIKCDLFNDSQHVYEDNVISYFAKRTYDCYAIQDTLRNTYFAHYDSIGSKAFCINVDYNKNIKNISLLKLKKFQERLKDPFCYNTDISLGRSSFRALGTSIKDTIKGYDFALILDVKKFKEKKISKREIIDKRSDSKRGALSLMDNEDIKTTNINRYFNKIISKYKISGDHLNDIFIFKKVIMRLVNNFIVYNLYARNNTIFDFSNDLNKRIYSIVKIINNRDLDDNVTMEDFLNGEAFKLMMDTINSYTTSKLEDNNYKNKKQIKLIKIMRIYANERNELNRERYVKILDLIDEISNVIRNYFENLPCDSIEDMDIICEEILTIENSLKSDKYSLRILDDLVRSMNIDDWRSGSDFDISPNNQITAIQGLEKYLSYIKKRSRINK